MLYSGRGWVVVPAEKSDGFWVKDTQHERCWCPTLEQAVEQCRQMNGEAYDALPAVRREEIREVFGPKIKTCEFPYHGWYRHVRYYHGDKCLGRIQTKYIRRRTTVLTLAEEGGCVVGSDLSWLCRLAGLRLVG